MKRLICTMCAMMVLFMLSVLIPESASALTVDDIVILCTVQKGNSLAFMPQDQMQKYPLIIGGTKDAKVKRVIRESVDMYEYYLFSESAVTRITYANGKKTGTDVLSEVFSLSHEGRTFFCTSIMLELELGNDETFITTKDIALYAVEKGVSPFNCTLAENSVAIKDIVFSPAPGFYDEAPIVTLFSTYGSGIYYTTDGSDPGYTDEHGLEVNGIKYADPFQASGTIKARTYWKRSEMAPEEYQNNLVFGSIVEVTYACPAPPTVLFDPAPGFYSETPTITLSSTNGCQILYTTDGSDPGYADWGFSLNGTKYTGPFQASGTIKARTYWLKEEYAGEQYYNNIEFSEIVQLEYIIGGGTQADPWLIRLATCPVEFSSGWYQITSDITATQRLNIGEDVHIVLGTGTTLTALQGINISSGNSLTISGSGTLTATGSRGCAGIGGGSGENCGTVIIESGTVNARGSVWGAGIGGGQQGSGGIITINGGTVNAQCYDEYDDEVGLAAGIGGGDTGSGGTITINGGIVYARGNRGSAGIGGGGYGSGGTITITGGQVTAIGSAYQGGRSGAGIGAGRAPNNATTGDSGTIRITGGTVTAIPGANAQAIGVSNEVAEQDSGTLTLGEITVWTSETSDSPAVRDMRGTVCRGDWVRTMPCIHSFEPAETSGFICVWCGRETGSSFGPAGFILPAGLTTVNEGAFENAISIVSVDAGHCTSIASYAFRGCTGLKQIRLPQNCVIDPTAFDGCGTVCVYAPPGGTTEAFCQNPGNRCTFIPER